MFASISSILNWKVYYTGSDGHADEMGLGELRWDDRNGGMQVATTSFPIKPLDSKFSNFRHGIADLDIFVTYMLYATCQFSQNAVFPGVWGWSQNYWGQPYTSSRGYDHIFWRLTFVVQHWLKPDTIDFVSVFGAWDIEKYPSNNLDEKKRQIQQNFENNPLPGTACHHIVHTATAIKCHKDI